MVTMHEKSTKLDGAPATLEDLFVASLGVVKALLFITTNSGESTKKASKMGSFASKGGLFLEVEHFFERCLDQG